MAITLVTSGTANAANPALSGGLLPGSEGANSLSFGDLLSFQINGLPVLPPAISQAPAPEADSQSEAANDAVDAGSLLAGMLAVSPETAPATKVSLPETTTSAQIAQTSIQANGTANNSKADAQLLSLTQQAQMGSPANPLTALPSATEQASALMAKTTSAAILAAPANQTAEAAPTDFAATLNLQAANQGATTQRHDAVATASVDTPIQDQRWAQSFGDRIVWLAKNDQQSAQININPPQLGPVQINLKINGDQATMAFASPHAEVRQAIEDAMPRLREVLAGAGIDLGQTNVGAQLAQHDQRNQASSPDSSRFSGDKAILRDNAGRSGELPAMTGRSGRSLVDLFA